MDLPPPVQDPERRDDADDPARRLAALEAGLIALGARVEQLEASLQEVVREETRRASNEIRHTVSELGRRLALDLPQFLDRHRQLIVGELRGGASGTTAAGAESDAPSATTTATPPSASTGATGSNATGGTGGTGASGPSGDADEDDGSTDDGGGRRKRRRGRKDG